MIGSKYSAVFSLAESSPKMAVYGAMSCVPMEL